jgi:vacuolar-type H+-ATPase subunit F/Vma7
VSAWNIYKHRQSKKHAFNSLTEDEQKILISDKMALKIKKQIENLENSLAKIQ